MNDEEKVRLTIPTKDEEADLRLRNQGVVINPYKHDWCKGTGAIPQGITIKDPVVEGGKIVRIGRIDTHWIKCRCPEARFWMKFHPLNVRARLIPHWRARLKELLFAEAQKICPDHFSIVNHPAFRTAVGEGDAYDENSITGRVAGDILKMQEQSSSREI